MKRLSSLIASGVCAALAAGLLAAGGGTANAQACPVGTSRVVAESVAPALGTVAQAPGPDACSPPGTVYTLTATPIAPGVFTGWKPGSGDCVPASVNSPSTTCTSGAGDSELAAGFAADACETGLKVDDAVGGASMVALSEALSESWNALVDYYQASNPSMVQDGGICFPAGYKVPPITALADTGYQFLQWATDPANAVPAPTNPTVNITIPADSWVTLDPIFVPAGETSSETTSPSLTTTPAPTTETTQTTTAPSTSGPTPTTPTSTTQPSPATTTTAPTTSPTTTTSPAPTTEPAPPTFTWPSFTWPWPTEPTAPPEPTTAVPSFPIPSFPVPSFPVPSFPVATFTVPSYAPPAAPANPAPSYAAPQSPTVPQAPPVPTPQQAAPSPAAPVAQSPELLGVPGPAPESGTPAPAATPFAPSMAGPVPEAGAPQSPIATVQPLPTGIVDLAVRDRLTGDAITEGIAEIYDEHGNLVATADLANLGDITLPPGVYEARFADGSTWFRVEPGARTPVAVLTGGVDVAPTDRNTLARKDIAILPGGPVIHR